VPNEEEIKAIIELWNQGKSYGDIAKHLNGKRSTVQGWIEGLIKKGKIEPRTNGICTNTRKATNAHIIFNRQKRLELNDKFLKIIDDRINDNPTNTDLRNLAWTYGVMVDKREILEPPAPLSIEDDGFVSALESKAEEVFDAQDIPVQVGSPKPQAMADLDLVDQSQPNP
jgi:DNA-binding MarR family transcriptional regulator